MPRVRRSEEDQKLVESHGPDFLELLARGLKALSAFNAEKRQMTLSELATAVEVPRASVRRILFTLERLGFVESDGRLFKLTPRVLTLASAYLASSTIPTVLQPIVERVSARIKESCSAAILDGDDVVFIARASPVRIISVGLEIGYRLPAHCTAVGRVMLAGLNDADLDAWLDRTPLSKMTDRTVTDRQELRAAVLKVREQSYSLVDEEAEQGFRSLAVPVRRVQGSLACALHIGVRIERVSTPRMLDEFLPLLNAAAADAATMLL